MQHRIRLQGQEIDIGGYTLVTTLREAMVMRSIRNEVRQYMTGDQREISVLRQVRWYFSTFYAVRPSSFVSAWLVQENKGYGLLQSIDNEKVWLTGAIREASRGEGLGRKLFEFLTSFTTTFYGEAWLKVWHWNDRAIKLYQSLGYKEVRRADGIVTMVVR